ncbi:DUF2800 domain-containing protein [Halalkalibacterium halodurans]|uniref:DUF2800 domain-containing protein n=1 Tax=Halalkalibacterium halodurans TaxID=86665 RepID=UPI002E1E225B|nr:DUF2800 domain-containing protein [Halalkalibacterium halodurans]MED4086614.1 DUF2800 domain-containing protein [Halalkalibacterium halodurans]MED4104524.1 DUF2800 domain-containing protein [Halalkalibacterium halodurans]MED4110116.1 DUF2800 domain-containing protein [Halalkalibacterium halodurans]MED4149760.1 DUF2800 domain-containing protein [Halalkalibacterium halodurans]
MSVAHADRDHAKLSASGSSRWLKCTPSVQLEEEFEETTSVFAEEGTAAHELSELFLQLHFEQINKRTFTRRYNKFKKENGYYSEGMEEYVKTYVEVVVERANETFATSPDAQVLLEQQLDFSQWVPEGFGTGDVLIIGDGTLEVVDLKYGKGVPVSAEGNSQMRLYALGALDQYGFLYDIERVRMTIVQPRLDNISTDEVSSDNLLKWAEEEVKPKALMAWNGDGEFVAGDHCRFCRAKAVCKARADHNLKMAMYDFRSPDLLTHEEIGQILHKAEELKRWAKDVQDYALVQAEEHGAKFSGWKLVEGRSNRKYTDEKAVKDRLLSSGYVEDEIFKPREVLGISAMEKTIGKKKFAELLEGLVIKPSGKPTLVPESDKRPELNSIDSAIEDFS